MTRPVLPRFALALLVAAGLPWSGACSPAAPAPDGLLREDAWYEISLDGAHVGWMHRARRPAAGGKVVTTEEAEMEVLRFGETIAVRTRHVFTETRDGEPLSFESRVTMSRDETTTRGTVRGRKLVVKVATAGGEREVTHDWPQGALFPYGADLLGLRMGLEPGTTWSYRTFSPDLNGVITERARVDGPSEVETADGRRTLVLVTSSTEELAGQETRLWLDAEGRQVVVEVPALEVRMVRTSEERARRKAEPSSDLAAASFVPVEIPAADPEKMERIVYRLRRASGSWDGVELEDARQRVLRREGGEVLLEVRRGADPSAAPASAGPGAPPADLLNPSAYLETDSPEVRRALREALGPGAEIRERKAGEAAARLARWVRDHVDERALDVGFATAAEVARDRKGDCTEHAVLLAALLRAAGIPSRVRAGLLYVGGGFGYHLWTQAWLGGGWVDLDPTLGGGPVDALHIGLAVSDLGTGSPLLGLAALGPLVGDLRIEVAEPEAPAPPP